MEEQSPPPLDPPSVFEPLLPEEDQQEIAFYDVEDLVEVQEERVSPDLIQEDLMLEENQLKPPAVTITKTKHEVIDYSFLQNQQEDVHERGKDCIFISEPEAQPAMNHPEEQQIEQPTEK